MLYNLERTKQETKQLKEQEGKIRRSKYLRCEKQYEMGGQAIKVRRHKKHREKDNKALPSANGIVTNDNLNEDHIFNSASMAYSRRTSRNQILVNLSFFFYFFNFTFAFTHRVIRFGSA